MKLLALELAAMLEFGGFIHPDPDDAMLCRVGYLCDLINSRCAAEPGYALQLCNQHAGQTYAWAAAIAAPLRYRCPICEPQRDNENPC
jgi:hypothetical protein